jgi:putative modified peptide
MSKARLPREHELNLLKKLSTDDAYRARFEKSPTEALKEIGVPDAAIGALPADSLKSGKLADKSAIADALKKLSDANTSDQVCLVVPFMRLN